MNAGTSASRPAITAALLVSALASLGVATAGNDTDTLDEDRMAAGFQTVDTACFSCHSPDAGQQNRIAPPMVAIKRHYLDPDTGYEAFRDALVGFVNDPSADNARMPQAIERFGLMPKMSFDDAVLADVAYYLYHATLQEPGWFAQHYAEEKARYAAAAAPLQTTADYLRHGQQLAMQTKTALGSRLKGALQEGGPEGAVAFCKTQAQAITGEMSATLGASIRRVSDRPRNPDNAANDDELAIIEQFRAALAEQQKPTAVAREVDGQVIGYYPIVTNGMCLQCHGSVESDIRPGTLAVIRDAYPSDEATGYGINELRGLFVVAMDKQDGAASP